MATMFHMECCKVWYWLPRVGVCVLYVLGCLTEPSASSKWDLVWADASVFSLKKKKIKRGKFGRYGNLIVNARYFFYQLSN